VRIGDQELALLTFIAERGSATVGEVAEQFGGPRNLARSTVLTMMERLRLKRRLTRKRVDGVFRYSSPNSRKDVLNEVVTDFVEKTLGGSLSPFVAYLTRSTGSTDVSDEELAELERVVASLQKQRKES
jgi:predicted transcriptional regulator